MSVTNQNLWKKNEIISLIEIYESLPELWDPNHSGYKEREKRNIAIQKISDALNVSCEEIRKKIHNLRCQFNAELRKIKKRGDKHGTDEHLTTSDWKFFENFKFLMRANSTDGDLPVVLPVANRRSVKTDNSYDSDNSMDSSTANDCKKDWKKEETICFIQEYETLEELWNPKDSNYKDREKRSEALNQMSQVFNVSLDEIKRKIHNLRCQFSCELRKIRRLSAKHKLDESLIESEWTYFKHLKFLSAAVNVTSNSSAITERITMKMETHDSSESEDNEGYESETTTSNPLQKIHKPEVVYTTEREINIFTSKHKVSADNDHKIFGEYVASELRNLSERNAKKLKLMIRKSILEVTEEEFNMENSGHSPDLSEFP